MAGLGRTKSMIRPMTKLMIVSGIVIVSAARTPVGSFNGAFATTPAHDLGAIAIKAALERAGVEGGQVSEVIMGQILTAAQGQNPARQASIAAGIPVESPAWGVNQLCGSGLRTVALGYQALLNGDSSIVVAGGQESMSMAPHAQYLRGGVKMGGLELIDTMIKDGLWDAFNGYHMGNTAENVAKQYQITRAQQDEFAVGSQNKAEAAQKAGKFKDEIVPVTIKSRKGDIVVDADEYPRHGATIDAMAKLRAAFEKDGTVTNSERRISRVLPAVPAPGQARHDWDIVVDLARRLEQLLPERLNGRPTLFPYADAEAIWHEHRESTRGRDLDIPGRQEAAANIHIGIEWLANVSFGHTESIGRRVIVLGGGNTAMDCCRTARRLGIRTVAVYADADAEAPGGGAGPEG